MYSIHYAYRNLLRIMDQLSELKIPDRRMQHMHSINNKKRFLTCL